MVGGLPVRDGAIRSLLAHQFPARSAPGRHGRGDALCAAPHRRFLPCGLVRRARGRARTRHAHQAYLRHLHPAAASALRVAWARVGAARPQDAGPRTGHGRGRPARAAVVWPPPRRPPDTDGEPGVPSGSGAAESGAADHRRAPLLSANPADPVRAPGLGAAYLGALGYPPSALRALLPLARDPGSFRRLPSYPEQEPPLHATHPPGRGPGGRARAPGAAHAVAAGFNRAGPRPGPFPDPHVHLRRALPATPARSEEHTTELL